MKKNTKKIPWQSKLIIVLATAAGICVFFSLLHVHVQDEIDWRDNYSHVIDFGDRCGYRTGQWDNQFEVKLTDRVSLTKLQMPYRGQKNAPTLKDGEYIHTRCLIPKEVTLLGKSFLTVSLGMVFGHSRIYYNNQLVLDTGDPGPHEIQFPIKAEPPIQIDIISLKSGIETPGLASLLPIFVAPTPNDLQPINRALQSFQTEQPAFRIGICFIILASFLLLWLYGLRYNDILWTIVFAAAVSVQNGFLYLYTFTGEQDLISRFEATNFFLIAICNTLLLASLFRFKIRFSWLWWSILVGAGVLCFSVSQDNFFKWRLLDRTQTWVQIFGLTTTSILGITQHQLKDFASRRRREIYLFAAIGFISAITLAIQAILEDSQGFFLAPFVQIGLLLIFAAITLYNLAARQRDYFAEKRRADNAESLARAARLISHDLKRPFAQMKALSSLVASKKLPETKLEELRDSIRSSRDYAEGLLDDMMQINSRVRLSRISCDLAEILRECTLTLNETIEQKQIKLTTNAAESAFYGDKAKLLRVFRNILENAVQATPKGGSINVGISENQSRYLISVFNSGSFIDPDRIAKIFDLHYTSGKKDGSGFGLTIAQQFIEAHGGTVICRSDRDKGTTFHISLLKSANLGETGTSPNAKVIVIDDDELFLINWQRQINDAQVVTYSTIKEFVTKAEFGPETIIVSDLHFDNSTHDINQVIEIAQKNNTPLILSTNDSAVEDDIAEKVDLIIDKRPRSYSELCESILGQDD